jgi:hypothetical protein
VKSDLERIQAVRAAIPPGQGLFAEKEWLITPEPFVIDAQFADALARLGHRLYLFNRACNLLYHLSVRGKQPAWIADYLDRGKPPELVAFSREKKFRDDLPRVIRPDLILTESGSDKRPGFTIAELDNVPGGIGLTAWLGRTYAQFSPHEILGGPDGMIEGFRRIMPGGDILVSQEAATYKPEMEWMAGILTDEGMPLRVAGAETYSTPPPASRAPQSIYRFFELFDLPNIPAAQKLMEAARAGEVTITPPVKPFLEEKMWFALFWLRPLREFWRRELGERHWLKLREHIPYTWILDPAPLPQHAVIPELEIQSWSELGDFSQKQRELILKISGFSELAWGSRGVSLGQDMPQHEWRGAVAHALADFETHPYILQRFHKGRLVAQPYFDKAEGAIRTLNGRVRLCPYYFVHDGRAELKGALATICPADKKLLHGMSEAILAPTAVRQF